MDGPACAGDGRASGREARGRMIGRFAPAHETVGQPGTGPSERARLDEEDEGRPAEPAQERELDGAGRAEGPDEERQKDQADDRAPPAPCARRSRISKTRLLRVQTARRPWSARISVTSSAYSRSPPTGRPRAMRVTEPTTALQPLGQVHRRGLALEGRVGRDDDLLEGLARRVASSARVEQLADLEPLGPDAVDGRDGAVEDVVEAPELPGALEGEDVERLLDDAQPASARGPDRGRSGTSGASLMLKQRSQKTTWSRTAMRARASVRASASGRAGGGTSGAARSWARSRAGARRPR